jgi:hypothetical protein
LFVFIFVRNVLVLVHREIFEQGCGIWLYFAKHKQIQFSCFFNEEWKQRPGSENLPEIDVTCNQMNKYEAAGVFVLLTCIKPCYPCIFHLSTIYIDNRNERSVRMEFNSTTFPASAEGHHIWPSHCKGIKTGFKCWKSSNVFRYT